MLSQEEIDKLKELREDLHINNREITKIQQQIKHIIAKCTHEKAYIFEDTYDQDGTWYWLRCEDCGQEWDVKASRAKGNYEDRRNKE